MTQIWCLQIHIILWHIILRYIIKASKHTSYCGWHLAPCPPGAVMPCYIVIVFPLSCVRLTDTDPPTPRVRCVAQPLALALTVSTPLAFLPQVTATDLEQPGVKGKSVGWWVGGGWGIRVSNSLSVGNLEKVEMVTWCKCMQSQGSERQMWSAAGGMVWWHGVTLRPSQPAARFLNPLHTTCSTQQQTPAAGNKLWTERIFAKERDQIIRAHWTQSRQKPETRFKKNDWLCFTPQEEHWFVCPLPIFTYIVGVYVNCVVTIHIFRFM